MSYYFYYEHALSIQNIYIVTFSHTQVFEILYFREFFFFLLLIYRFFSFETLLKYNLYCFISLLPYHDLQNIILQYILFFDNSEYPHSITFLQVKKKNTCHQVSSYIVVRDF